MDRDYGAEVGSGDVELVEYEVVYEVSYRYDIDIDNVVKGGLCLGVGYSVDWDDDISVCDGVDIADGIYIGI